MGSGKSRSSEAQSNHSQTSPEDDRIRRLAIDQSGLLGSLYNARNDRLIPQSIFKSPPEKRFLQQSPLCNVLRGNEWCSRLFDVMKIDKELTLSILLNMVPPHGIISLIDNPPIFNEYTRILCYYYVHEENTISKDGKQFKSKDISVSVLDTSATHVVTTTRSGIQAIIVLQLSPGSESNLDPVLNEISSQLVKNTFRDDMIKDNMFNLLKVYSNIPELCELTQLADACGKIIELNQQSTYHRLLNYILRPVTNYYLSYPLEKARFVPLNSANMDRIQQHLCKVLIIRTSLKALPNAKLQKDIDTYIKNQFEEVQKQISAWQVMEQTMLERYRDLVREIRSGNRLQETLDEKQHLEDDEGLVKTGEDISRLFTSLKRKAQLIQECKNKKIKYWNVKALVKEHDTSLETIIRLLRESTNVKLTFYCFDDRLEQPDSEAWNIAHGRLLSARQKHSKSELVYADFSYCSYQLKELGLSIKNDGKAQVKPVADESPAENTTVPVKRVRADPSNTSADNFVNVLLLGESGVGKSTFINAIANYLTFDTLDAAHDGQLKVLMSVSFLMTVGYNFDERTIRFGDEDSNEDHDHPGQSVTQRCKSYVFSIDAKTKLRLIDTPGLSDTRGLAQDDLNMKHILTFINNLPHLNAVCILLKPDESKLHIAFRSYFNRLTGFLGENVRGNIIFCFTNTRKTFFAPGNTGTLVRQMLQSHPIQGIPFQKTNVFCFDSESFRYLIACRNGIQFDANQKHEYQRSWTASVNESKRFLNCLQKGVKPFSQTEWQSLEHAQFQIDQLIAPSLETLANAMRNMILLEKSKSNARIKLDVSAVPDNSTFCQQCNRSLQACGEFYIVFSELHTVQGQCDRCSCDISRHTETHYQFIYTTRTSSSKQSLETRRTDVDALKQKIVDLVYIFKNVIRINKDEDPMFCYLNRILIAEKHFRSQTIPENFNKYLYEELRNFKKAYEGAWNMPTSTRNSLQPAYAYELISNLCKNALIKEQVLAIKQIQEKYMLRQEKNV